MTTTAVAAAPATPERPDPATWEDPTMRQALAAHDIAVVYRQLIQAGYSQLGIGHLTGQSQPEVCSILKGRRVITSYASLNLLTSYVALAPLLEGGGRPASSGVDLPARTPRRRRTSGLDPLQALPATSTVSGSTRAGPGELRRVRWYGGSRVRAPCGARGRAVISGRA
ncbi:MAG TPA: hypothetical protein VLJ59_19775 [Mycobacteriales bacterium]|nr:hypothetical protein [Mycobacteriales bacterium]